MVNYFKGVAQEMRNVTWPNGKQTNKETWTVIVVSLLFGLFLGGADWILSHAVNWLIGN
ncbi:MAG TPA: preprotein translocase subunit SecE [Lactobacillaceae bacterium]|jgi:preprotein translocase subunit SecE